MDGDRTLVLEREGAVPVTAPLGRRTDHDRLFSGSGICTKDIGVPASPLDGRRIPLDLGDVRDVAAVTVNGTPLPPLLWASYEAP
ncbi:hypothetical protein [Streptomyces sp. NPDC020996]|uniref:hypothetical protein n=1 Tax=Streptomyces sp. NPDC020996 TaxID=3154791 RepID=UPI0033EE1260